jgi:hypothetical protein
MIYRIRSKQETCGELLIESVNLVNPVNPVHPVLILRQVGGDS